MVTPAAGRFAWPKPAIAVPSTNDGTSSQRFIGDSPFSRNMGRRRDVSIGGGYLLGDSPSARGTAVRATVARLLAITFAQLPLTAQIPSGPETFVAVEGGK